MSRWVMMLAAMADVEHRVAIVAEVERDRRDPHGRADAGGRLTAPARRNAALQVGQHLAESSGRSPGGHPRTTPWASPAPGRARPAAPDRPAMIQQDIAEGQGLLRVVGVEPPQSPSIGLSLPGLNAVDVILDPTVVRLDLLGRQALQRCAQARRRRPDPADTLGHGRFGTDEASWQCSSDAESLTGNSGSTPRPDDRRIPAWTNLANRILLRHCV